MYLKSGVHTLFLDLFGAAVAQGVELVAHKSGGMIPGPSSMHIEVSQDTES